jgi:hypothetical protein
MTGMPLPRLGVPRSSITRTGDTADGYRVVSARRLAHPHSPLSLLEIGLAVVVVGVAAAVAVPEYLQLRQDASDDSAKSRLAHAAGIVEAHDRSTGTFSGAALPAGVRLRTFRGSYCVETNAGGRIWHAARHGKPAAGAC